MEKTKETILMALQLYCFTLIIPIISTAFIIVVVFFGVSNPDLSFGEMMYKVWIGYYFTGIIGSVIAWKIHVVILGIALVASIANNNPLT